MKKNVLICLDRDGTLIFDIPKHYFLGNDKNWKDEVKILPKVIEGLRLLKGIQRSRIYMISNQTGIAMQEHPNLTMESATEACDYVMEKINEHAKSEKGESNLIDNWFLCPHATPDYVKAHPKLHFKKEYIKDCDCFKPRLGMIFRALKDSGITYENTRIYVIGDRASDAMTGVNSGGIGIIIPFENQKGELDKLDLNHERLYKCKDMVEAAQLITNIEKEINDSEKGL